MEKLVSVSREKSLGIRIGGILMWVLFGICTLIVIFINLFFFLGMIIFPLIWYFAFHTANYEFDASYTDGRLVFARIRNKNGRKLLAKIDMDTVINIAPRGDRSIYKYENDRSVEYIDCTSQTEGNRVYAVIANTEAKTIRVEFEPDDDFLDAICDRYSRIVIRN